MLHQYHINAGLSSFLFMIPSYLSMMTYNSYYVNPSIYFLSIPVSINNFLWKTLNIALVVSSFLCNSQIDNVYFLYFDYITITCISSSYINNYIFVLLLPIEYWITKQIVYSKNLSVISAIAIYGRQNHYIYAISVVAFLAYFLTNWYHQNRNRAICPTICPTKYLTIYPTKYLTICPTIYLTWLWYICITVILSLSTATMNQ